MIKIQDTRYKIQTISNFSNNKFQKRIVWNFGHWNLKFVCFLVIVSCILTISLPVFAGGLVPCTDNCTLMHLFELIKNIMNWMLWYGGIIAALFIACGGIMMLLSRGNEARITKAKMWITNAVIGLLIVFCAWLIINTIFFVLQFPSSKYEGEFKWPTWIEWGK